VRLVAPASGDTPRPTPKPTDVIVKPGTQPFTYYTGDQHGEYLTHVDGERQSCNCGHTPDGRCVHVAAVQVYLKG
jgi:hypothetical protein